MLKLNWTFIHWVNSKRAMLGGGVQLCVGVFRSHRFGSAFLQKEDLNKNPHSPPKMAVLEFTECIKIQCKYLLLEVTDNFNQGLHFIALVVNFYKTKTVLCLNYVFVL